MPYTDPSNFVEYYPPAFSNLQKYLPWSEGRRDEWGELETDEPIRNWPDEPDNPYDQSKTDAIDDMIDKDPPVAISDDMILRAHYLDLGLANLHEKSIEQRGYLNDHDYLQYHRMEGELRKLLKHIWEVGRRALEFWVRAHKYGSLPAAQKGYNNISGLIDILRSFDMPADPVINIIEEVIPGSENIDWENDAKRMHYGISPLYGEESSDWWDENERKSAEAVLDDEGVNDWSELDVSNDAKWDFIEDVLGLYSGDLQYKSTVSYLDEVDPNDPWSFYHQQGEMSPEEQEMNYGVYEDGFVHGDIYAPIQKNDNAIDPNWHIPIYARMRLHPEYEKTIDEAIIDATDPVNNMRTHNSLLSEIDMDIDEWNALDTKTQMAIISRLMSSQHRTGDILTDMVPSFQFLSGQYAPHYESSGQFADHRMGKAPSGAANAAREMLDDLHQSSMVESWQQFFEEHPGERWSSQFISNMIKLASNIDGEGASDLADRMDEMIRSAQQASSQQPTPQMRNRINRMMMFYRSPHTTPQRRRQAHQELVKMGVNPGPVPMQSPNVSQQTAPWHQWWQGLFQRKQNQSDTPMAIKGSVGAGEMTRRNGIG